MTTRFPIKINTNTKIDYNFDFSINFLNDALTIPESYYGVILDDDVINPSSGVKPSDEYLTEAETVMPTNVTNTFYKDEVVVTKDEKLVGALLKAVRENNLKLFLKIFEQGNFDINAEYNGTTLLEESTKSLAYDIATWLYSKEDLNRIGRFDTTGILPSMLVKGDDTFKGQLQEAETDKIFEAAQAFEESK
jgi:hypothetical protein